MDLEKLVHLSGVEKRQTREALSYRHCNPKRERLDLPYLKYNLVYVICQAIIPSNQPSEQRKFSKVLYNAVNKEPLKRVNYGIRSTGNLPINFITTLTRWEGIYFFRGRWSIREPNLQEPVEVITARHVLEGLEKLYEDHYVRKAQGKYKSQLELPEDKEIREQTRRIIRDYELEQEKIIIQQSGKKPAVTKPKQGRFFPSDFPRPD